MRDLHILSGPDAGSSFELREGANYIGRSEENTIQIRDETVSRRHLRILKKSETYLMTDLGSRNCTFFNGNYLIPGIEVEVKKGTPIAIGMTIMGIGDEFSQSMLPLVGSLGLTRETGNSSGLFSVHKEKTNQKKLELLYKITDLLRRNLSKKDTLEIQLETFLQVLARVDRATFILVGERTGEIVESISRSKGNGDTVKSAFSQEIVARVLDERKPLIINDTDNEETESDLANTLKMENVKSVMCIPMMAFSELFGVLYVDSLNKAYPFAEEDITLFQDIANRTAAFLLSEALTG
jgi:pSer/pThr/pTyr-binding forkhead associated (FHA) protein